MARRQSRHTGGGDRQGMADPAPAFDETADVLSLGAALAGLADAQIWLEAIAERDGWPNALVLKLQLSLEEALVNIMSHGFPDAQDRATAVITLSYVHRPDMLWLRIRDNGRPFDPTLMQEAPLPQSIESAEIGGHGIRIIRRFVDEFRYCQTAGNNQLILGAKIV